MKMKRVVSAVSALSIAMSMGLFLPQSPVYATGSVEINETNFPDPAFRAYISENFDTGDIPGTLTESEIQAVTNISLCDRGITTLEGIGFFPKLMGLDCSRNNLTSIDLSGNPNMCNIFIEDNPGISSIDVTGMANLENLIISRTGITSLDLSGNPKLFQLIADNMTPGLTSLDVSGKQRLIALHCVSAGLQHIDVTDCPYLADLYLGDNHLTELDLTGTGSIENLSIMNNDLSGLFSCRYDDCVYLACYGNNIDAIDIRGASHILEAYRDGVTVAVAGQLQNYETYILDLFDPVSPCLQFDPDTIVITTDEEYDAYIAAHPQQPEENPGGENPGSSGETPSEIVPEENGGSTPAPSENETPVVPVGTDTPTPAPSAPTSAPAATTERGVAGFVERLYTVALGRASDPVGKQDWIDAITLRGETGASCARGFLYSPEFLNKGVSNEDFVTVLYRTFFDREPDQAGFNAWVAVLNNGTSKEEVIEGFINSTEWANLCLFYGIRSGGTGVPSVEMEPNQDTIDFATRLYTTCLGRAADEAGLMAWARQLANQRDTGSGAARGFFFSSEFTGQNVSNGEFVTRLYRTFMDREPDQSGFDAWVAQLDSGVSREAVFDGFAESIEFARICAQYGIVK